MKKVIPALMIILTAVSACGLYEPSPGRMGGPKDGPPNYRAGWEDGCHTGKGTMSQGFYKSFYGFKQDVAQLDDPVYYKAWKDGYTYCRQYVLRYAWDPLDRAVSPALDNPLCVLCPNELAR